MYDEILGALKAAAVKMGGGMYEKRGGWRDWVSFSGSSRLILIGYLGGESQSRFTSFEHGKNSS